MDRKPSGEVGLGMAPRRPKIVPLVSLEAASVLTDRATEPHTIELTVEFSRPVDPEVIARGLRTAMAIHPMASVRLRRSGPLRRRLEWRGDESPPVTILDEPGRRTIGELASVQPDLASSPPFHASLGEHGDGSRLVLVVNHAAFDGVGAVRFLRTALEAAAGMPPSVPPVDELTARHLTDPVGKRSSDRPAGTPQRPSGPPDHLRCDVGTGHSPGFVVVHRSIPTKRVAGATVNDVVLAAFHRTLAGWIERSGTTSGPVVTLVPLNVRPPEWGRDVVGNHAWLTAVVSEPDDRASTDRLLRSIGAQMRSAKEAPPVPGGFAFLGGGFVPVAIARAGFAAASRIGRRRVATALVSNLGELAPFPDIDGSGVERVWFSPPCREPRPVSLGVVGHGGELQLSFRFRRTSFDDTSAESFAASSVAELEAIG